MYTVNLGGTAVGTAINVSDSYFYKIVPNLEKITGYPLKQAEDLFDATENLDGFVAVSGVVKNLCGGSFQDVQRSSTDVLRPENRIWGDQPSGEAEWVVHHAG